MPIKIMVSSSVYGFEDTLTQLCAVLESYGYEVLNSHYGTIARQLLKKFAPVLPDQVYKADGTRLFPLPAPPALPVNPFRGNSVLDDYRVIAMLNEAQAGTPGSPLMARPNRWSQEFATTEALLRTIQAQFSNHTVLAAELAALAGGTP
ncbi:hypothetical protein [Armatimonas sp.]|uniref:hypothetical protein n=1 Tax=Armatimonas sp. TaxID=1872638 RepID=UPI003751EFDC